MSMLALVMALLLVLGLLAGALSFSLSCRIGRAGPAGAWRPLAANGLLLLLVVGATLLQWHLISPATQSAESALVRLALIPCTWLPLPLLCCLVFVRASVRRKVLAGLVWSCFCLVLVVFVGVALGWTATEGYFQPTGSMAETVWGYHKDVVCPKCAFPFPVNCSSEVEPSPGQPPEKVTGCTCPNCRYAIDFEREGMSPAISPCDRVLVAKAPFGLWAFEPERLGVVVFRYPGPQGEGGPVNYLKRVIGRPGETLAIHAGKLYVLPADRAPRYAEEADETAAMHINDRRALAAYAAGEFELLRKPPDKILALRRLVYDHDFPARDRASTAFQRWQGQPGGGWQSDGAHGFRCDAARDRSLTWLLYRHWFPPGRRNPVPAGVPGLITSFLGYNTGQTAQMQVSPGEDWVGDLMLECAVTVEEPAGELVLELARGVDRFRARWDLATGICTLLRVTDGAASNEEERALARQGTSLKGKTTRLVRFANVDERLIVWVGSELPFGDGVVYEPPARAGPTAHDLEPASIGVSGGKLRVDKLKLWRDTYYTVDPGQADAPRTDWSDPARWAALRKLPVRTFAVQPGHYFCLGDNSVASSDSRLRGLVPERLLIGRALLIYYPLARAGVIR